MSNLSQFWGDRGLPRASCLWLASLYGAETCIILLRLLPHAEVEPCLHPSLGIAFSAYTFSKDLSGSPWCILMHKIGHLASSFSDGGTKPTNETPAGYHYCSLLEGKGHKTR